MPLYFFSYIYKREQLKKIWLNLSATVLFYSAPFQCTFLNSDDADFCTMCGNPRAAGGTSATQNDEVQRIIVSFELEKKALSPSPFFPYFFLSASVRPSVYNRSLYMHAHVRTCARKYTRTHHTYTQCKSLYSLAVEFPTYYCYLPGGT